MNRISIRDLRKMIACEPDLVRRFAYLREQIMPIHASQYDVTNLCNLSCVGCLYFDGENHWRGKVEDNESALCNFFEAEKKRGVNFPHFGGAEPALNPTALRAANRFFSRGVIYSNGSHPIARDINFAIHISVWSDIAQEKTLRGNSALMKALKHYSGDSRAVFVMTLSSKSISNIEGIVSLCKEHNTKLTFNHYSPPIASQPEKYLRKNQLFNGIHPDQLYLSAFEIKKAHEKITELKQRFHSTIIYSCAYGEWISQNQGIYNIDPKNDQAIDCASRLTEKMRHFHPDLSREKHTKCCTPNIDCRTCRLYAMAYASKINLLEQHIHSLESFKKWLDIAETWSSLFIPNQSNGSEQADAEIIASDAQNVYDAVVR